MSIFKKIGKAIGKIAKGALPVLKLGVGFVPGVGSVASAVLNSKLGKLGSKAVRVGERMNSTMRMMKQSPVLPGGAVATPSGAVASSGNPPAQYAGSGGGGGHLRKRRKTRKRTTRTKSYRRKSRGRKLKFGSAAYRRKFLGHR